MGETGNGTRCAMLESLSPGQREQLAARSQRRRLARGDRLFAEGETAGSLFVVTRGAFALLRGGEPVGEVRTGDLAGEAAFFAGLPHNSTAVAMRDAEVLELRRGAYDALAEAAPELAGEFLRLAARRLHQAAPRAVPARSRSRTVAVLPCGHEPVPSDFFRRLGAVLGRAGAVVVDRDTITDRFGALAPDDDLVGEWLDGLEHGGRQVFLFGEPELTAWGGMCVRHADEVVMVTAGEAPVAALTPAERLVEAMHPAGARRLVRLHPRRVGVVSGTSAWLSRMEVKLHHHVSLEDDADLEGLARFLTGRAVGFVAGGGGGFGPAHVGIYRAFREKGATFDAFVGTSVGAAMLAGFAFLGEHDRLTAGTEDIFVKSRSFKRLTVPRYSLLDHKVFDEALARAYGSTTLVEDCWRPFAAVATNLTTQSLELIRTGLLWKAVRASSAIPCVLPPFFTEDGTMLVDGGLMDDAPLAPMQALKAGPNLVVHFGRTGRQRFDFAYEDLPGRGRLLASLVNPRARLPKAPKMMSMLFRSLLVHQRYDLPLGPHDLVLTPPQLPGASLMSFDRHMEVFEAAHLWAQERIETMSAEGDAALSAILGPAGEAPPLAVAA